MPSSPSSDASGDSGRVKSAAAAIAESLHPWSAVAEGMGYGQSKWVAERMCAAASAAEIGVDARVLRVGQLCGDTAHGVWNTAEAIPTTVRAALTVGALPVVENEDDEELAWLPVDVAARAVVELAFADTAAEKAAAGGAAAAVAGGGQFRVWHVENERLVRWNGEFLPALRKAGLVFDAVPAREWVRRLERSEQDAERNPPVKLLEFFRKRYGTVGTKPHPVFDMTQARKFAPSLRGGTPVDEELVGKFLRFWIEEWSGPAGK